MNYAAKAMTDMASQIIEKSKQVKREIPVDSPHPRHPRAISIPYRSNKNNAFTLNYSTA